MQNLVTRFIKDESGATAIEYGLIAALISVALIAGAKAIGTGLDSKFGAIATEVGTKNAPNTGTAVP